MAIKRSSESATTAAKSLYKAVDPIPNDDPLYGTGMTEEGNYETGPLWAPDGWDTQGLTFDPGTPHTPKYSKRTSGSNPTAGDPTARE